MSRNLTSGHSSDDEAEAPPREQRNIEHWRMHVLTEAGYPYAEAQRLAMTFSVDLHVACEILKGGCPPEVAADILL